MREKLLRFLVIVLLSPLCCLSVPVALDDWAIDHFERARQAQDTGDFPRAAQEYRLVLSRNPNFAEGYLNLGIVYQQQSKYWEAAKVLQQALRIKPSLLPAKVVLGMSRYFCQDYQAALNVFREVSSQNPRERQAGIYHALTLSALEQPEKAAEELRRTLQYYPGDTEILYQLGEIYNNGLRQSAELLYRTSRDTALYYWAMGLSAEAKNNGLAAIRYYLQALSIDPNIPPIYVRLALLLESAGMEDLSQQATERLTALNAPRPFLATLHEARNTSSLRSTPLASDKRVYVALWNKIPSPRSEPGMILVADSDVNRMLKDQMAMSSGALLRDAVRLFEQGDIAQAAARLRSAIRTREETWIAGYLLARCYVFTGNFDEAEIVIEQLLARYLDVPSVALLKVEIQSELVLLNYDAVMRGSPNSHRARMLKARALAADHHLDEAISEYREVLRAMPSLPQVHLAIAQIYADQLNWPSVIQELNHELVVSPHNGLALALLGHAYVETGNADAALPVLTKVVSRYPHDALALADLGKALASEGQYAKAIRALEAALAHDESQYRLHYRLFELCRLTGQEELARKHLTLFQQESAKRKSRAPSVQ